MSKWGVEAAPYLTVHISCEGIAIPAKLAPVKGQGCKRYKYVLCSRDVRWYRPYSIALIYHRATVSQIAGFESIVEIISRICAV